LKLSWYKAGRGWLSASSADNIGITDKQSYFYLLILTAETGKTKPCSFV